MRRLIVDGQLFQTPAWHRGMGKYSLELLRALLDHNSVHHVWGSVEIILSDVIETESSVQEKIKHLLPEAKLTYLDLLPAEIDNTVPTKKNRQVVESYTRDLPAADTVDFFILSVLQGGIAPAFPMLPNVRKALLFYDLIPLMFFKIYLTAERVRQEYATHLEEFFKADTYLAISKTVANDLAWHTGTSYKRVAHITGGPIAHGRDIQTMDIPKPFILMHTGDDLRKNNRRGILAFEDFNKRHGHKYTLIVSSTFTDHERRELMKLSKNVQFVGNVSGEELNYLYKESEALFFPTEYEGLGLPVLEAMEWKKPILCSDIAVFREITPDLVDYFDPHDITSMSASLSRLAEGKITPDIKGYKAVLARYTWKRTAQEAVKALSAEVTIQIPSQSVTIFTPSPSQSFVGRHVQLLVSELGRLVTPAFRYESVKTKVEQRINYTAYTMGGSYAIDGRTSLEVSGQTLYNIADGPGCTKILFAALGKPGITILYDDSIESVWNAMKEQGLIHGTRLKAEYELSDRVAGSKDLLVSLVASQEALVVHSPRLEKELRRIAKKLGRADTIIRYIPLPTVETVYPEILPTCTKGKITVKGASSRLPGDIQIHPTNGLTDRAGEPLTDHQILERLGSSVAAVEDNSFAGESLKLLAQSLGIGAAKQPTQQQRIALADKVRAAHSYMIAAEAINKLIEELSHE